MPEVPLFYSKELPISVEKASVKFGLSKSYIDKLIKNGYIHATDLASAGYGLVLDEESCARLKVLADNPEYRKKFLHVNPSYFYDYCPELIGYLPFHDFIDRFCWLIKLYYNDKESIKKKKYRLDITFQNFLIKNSFSTEKLSRIVSKLPSNENKIVFHLTKGWYNELARSVPLKADYLNIGTKVKGSIPENLSVSWNITQTYYSIYEFFNAMDFCTVNKLDTVEHRKPTRFFNANILNMLRKNVLFYPFSLASKDNVPPRYPKHFKFNYATYPRDRSKGIKEIEKDILKMFKLIDETQGKRASLVDFFYEFRVWANYTGIETLVKLENGYLLDYLFRNLGTLNFFVAGMTELLILTKLGEQKYLRILNDFIVNYLLKQPNCAENKFIVPILVRHRIYKHLNIIKSNIPNLLPDLVDPIKMVNIYSDSTTPPKPSPEKYSKMPLSKVADIISKDWVKINPIAKENLRAMQSLTTIKDNYGADSGSAIIAYFLSNATRWQGPLAREIKQYLKGVHSKHLGVKK